MSTLEIVLAATYVAIMLPLINGLYPNIDEGVYAQLATKVLDGQVPLYDFFLHQPPFYLYPLAASIALAGKSLLALRLPSILAIALTGIVIARLARRSFGNWQSAVLAEMLWFAAPQQFLVAIGIPNAMAVLLAALAILVDAESSRGKYRWLSAVLFSIAVGLKPHVLPMGAFFVWPRSNQSFSSRAKETIAPMIICLVLLILILEITSAGGFSELAMLQAKRLGSKSNYDALLRRTTLHYVAQQWSIVSVYGWNVWTLTETLGLLLPLDYRAIVVIVPLVALTIVVLVRSRNRANKYSAYLVILVAQVLAFIFLWDPAWPHYVQSLLVAVCIVAGGLWSAVGLDGLCGRFRKQFNAATLILCACVPLWILKAAPPTTTYFQIDGPIFAGTNRDRPIFSWYTGASFLNGATPACGFGNSWSVIGENMYEIRNGKLFAIDRGQFERQIRDCVTSSGAQVLLDAYFVFFTASNPEWLLWARSLPYENIIFESEDERRYVQTGWHPLMNSRPPNRTCVPCRFIQ